MFAGVGVCGEIHQQGSWQCWLQPELTTTCSSWVSLAACQSASPTACGRKVADRAQVAYHCLQQQQQPFSDLHGSITMLPDLCCSRYSQ
jgi:hypothetical protein